MEMEKIVRQTILYDFYGELLTDHQKRIYEDIVFNDMSYSEIANAEGISRQGVYDLIKRCDKILEEYEAKLKLVEKFQNTKSMVAQIKTIANEMKEANDRELREGNDSERMNKKLIDNIEAIEHLSNSILEEY